MRLGVDPYRLLSEWLGLRLVDHQDRCLERPLPLDRLSRLSNVLLLRYGETLRRQNAEMRIGITTKDPNMVKFAAAHRQSLFIPTSNNAPIVIQLHQSTKSMSITIHRIGEYQLQDPHPPGRLTANHPRRRRERAKHEQRACYRMSSHCIPTTLATQIGPLLVRASSTWTNTQLLISNMIQGK